MASTQARERREAHLARMHERLTAAVEELVSGEDWARALSFAARFRSRSFNNTMLIWTQHLEAFEAGRVQASEPSYVAGFKQWQALGRQVDKGQSGYQIFAPVTARFASANPGDAQSWRRLEPREKPRAGEVVRSKVIAAKPAYVWDVSQTSGEPLPEATSPRLLEGEAPEGLWVGLSQAIQERGFAVALVPDAFAIDGANGRTHYGERTVVVRADMDPAAQVKTLAHELGHVVLHGPGNEEAGQHRGVSEVEAESVALMVGAAHGMDTADFTLPYVGGWAEQAAKAEERSVAEVIQATGERVRKAAVTILEGLSTDQISDGIPPGLQREDHRRSPSREPAAAVLPESGRVSGPEHAAPVGRGL